MSLRKCRQPDSGAAYLRRSTAKMIWTAKRMMEKQEIAHEILGRGYQPEETAVAGWVKAAERSIKIGEMSREMAMKFLRENIRENLRMSR